MEQVYSASAVSRPFWYVEFKKVMSLLNRGMSYEEIRTKALEDNLFDVGIPSQGDLWCGDPQSQGAGWTGRGFVLQQRHGYHEADSVYCHHADRPATGRVYERGLSGEGHDGRFRAAGCRL